MSTGFITGDRTQEPMARQMAFQKYVWYIKARKVEKHIDLSCFYKRTVFAHLSSPMKSTIFETGAFTPSRHCPEDSKENLAGFYSPVSGAINPSDEQDVLMK